MPKKVTLNIESHLYERLENRFKDDERGLNQFIIDAIRIQLSAPASSPDDKDGMENYLQKGSSGSRIYGVKGQGW